MPYLTTRQVCDELKISRWHVARLIRTGQLDAIKGEGRNGHVKIDEESLAAYIEAAKVEASA